MFRVGISLAPCDKSVPLTHIGGISLLQTRILGFDFMKNYIFISNQKVELFRQFYCTLYLFERR